MDTMKKGVIFTLLILLISACGKMPINGDLDGRWQIMKIEYASGEEETPERAYYSVALHTINLMQVGVTKQTGNMEYTGDSLFVTMPISTVEDLLPFGMNGTEQRFGVKELSSKHLVLQSDYARLEFRKF
ncbi:lipocalin-like domain-containing protein [Parabacteroides leei]|uniref:lipocalin-like domain-containing protein n=1 Tax=Parabacteroides leei TaxID=2939491 RepID=UPI00189B4912|nr:MULTISPECIES: lipocalin-like domain-containing protein [Parabacteroides]MCL3849944.1 lipocalin-like domain-containing protein [Parabacteroides leei]